ncbi:DUF4225 domain-containing protein [Enterobacter hormaechei subsp. xiangfangensis]|nr:DUF4225 domain-containing protein [Enterobacter hormaechei subsp. xiangfangensis]
MVKENNKVVGYVISSIKVVLSGLQIVAGVGDLPPRLDTTLS